MWNVMMRYLLIGSMIVLAFSCNPEKDTIAIITVLDESDEPVNGVEVQLFGSPSVFNPLRDSTRLNMTLFTNATGQATFDHTAFFEQGQSGFAVLDIVATKGMLVGTDLIRIVEEEVNEKTVVIK